MDWPCQHFTQGSTRDDYNLHVIFIYVWPDIPNLKIGVGYYYYIRFFLASTHAEASLQGLPNEGFFVVQYSCFFFQLLIHISFNLSIHKGKFIEGGGGAAKSKKKL